MRTFLASWYPRRSIKIRLHDIGAVGLGPPEPCRRCLGQGYVTPFTYAGPIVYPCYCDNGTTRYPLPVWPRSPYTLVLRWTDPVTGTTHARLWGRANRHKKSNRQAHDAGGGIRPSCGNGGMRATLKLRDFSVEGNITCCECALIVERSFGLAPTEAEVKRIERLQEIGARASAL